MDLSPDEDNFQGRLLHQAALWDNVELLQELLSTGADVDARDGNSRTALHAAALAERSNCLRALCEAGADVNAASDASTGGKTALHIAAERGHSENVRALITAGAELGMRDGNGDTAQALAERRAHRHAARVLHQATDALDRERHSHHAVLRELVSSGDSTGLQARLEALEANAPLVANLAPGGANTLLYVASEAGLLQAVTALLDAGADGRAHPVTKYCPLYIACYHGHKDIAATLLRHFPEAVQQETVERWLPLHAACIGGHAALVTLLLEYPYPQHVLNTYTDSTGQWEYKAAFDVNARDVSGQSALYVACTLGNLSVVDALLSHTVPAVKKEREKSEEPESPAPPPERPSPVRAGISMGIHAIVSKLTGNSKQEMSDEHRIRPVRVDSTRSGDSCLSRAVRTAHGAVVRRLLCAGASPDATAAPPADATQSSPRSRRRSRSACVVPSRSSASPSPARPCSNDREGPWTALALAAYYKNSALVEMLLAAGASDTTRALQLCARHLPALVPKLLATRAYADPEFKLNKSQLSEAVFNGREGDNALTYNAICPALPVVVNWRDLKCQLAAVRMSWLRAASLRVNPRLGSARAALALHALTRVDLSNNELRALPPELFTMLSLRYLNAAQNKLERLPSPSDPFEEDIDSKGRKVKRRKGRPEVYSAPVLQELYLQDNRLEELPPSLFTLPALTTLDVSNNKLRALPGAVWNAPQLKDLNAALNHLRDLPRDCETEPTSPSQVVSPSESSPALSTSSAPFSFGSTTKSWSRSPSIERSISECGNEAIPSLGNRQGNSVCTDARRVHVWRNVSDSEPASQPMPGSSGLTTLNLSHNQLTCVPPALACRAPQLHHVNMAYNSLRSMSYVTSYPTSLRQLDLSHNEITCWPSLPQVDNLGTVEGDPLACYCAMRGERARVRSGTSARAALMHAACPARRHLRLDSLRTLILANNLLTRIQLTTDDDGDVTPTESAAEDADEEWESNSSIRTRLLFPHLSMLDVSSNMLRGVPRAIHQLTNLAVLNLSANKEITDLPPQMGLLSRLWNLNVWGCSLSEPLRTMVCSGRYKSMDIVGYLKSVLQDARPYTALKLMLVGQQSIGKTSLLECLRHESAIQHRRKGTDHWAKRMGNKSSKRNVSTVGVDIGTWVYEKTRSSRGPVTFRTWDFGGQQEYYATHQYFLSRRSLYLVVWRLTDGRKGLADALSWLRSIQARAPGSPVIMVGTHYDQVANCNLSESESPEVLQRVIRSSIMGAPDADKLGLPRVLDTIEVSCSTRHNIRLLADIIYSVAFSVKPPGSKEPLLEQRVPATYLALEECVHALAGDLREPVLREHEFKHQVTQYMQQKNLRSFRDAAELHQATMFLHENGVLLHYDDATLKELYFLRPQWLCDVLAHVVTVREVNPFACNGIMKVEDLSHVLKASPALGGGAAARALAVSLLTKFELALSWDSKLLLPSLLPQFPPAQPQLPLRSRPWVGRGAPKRALSFAPGLVPSCDPARPTDSPTLIQESSGNITVSARGGGSELRRLLLLSYVPLGFWARLVTRLLADPAVTAAAQALYKPSPELEIDELTSQSLELPWSWSLWQRGVTLSCGALVLMSLYEKPPTRDQLLGHDHETGGYDRRLRVRQEGVWSTLDLCAFACVHIELPARVCVLKRDDGLPIGGYQSISLEPNLETLTKVLALISDHVDLLLEDWYPSLGTRFVHTSEGRCLITRVVPCPVCWTDQDSQEPSNQAAHAAQVFRRLELAEQPPRPRVSQDSRASDGDSGVGAESNASSRMGSVEGIVNSSATVPAAHGWTVEECILCACTGQKLTCPVHDHVSLRDVAPDTLLLDIEEEKLARWDHITHTSVAGRGAFGTVLAATWKPPGRAPIQVAVKALQPVPPPNASDIAAQQAYKAAVSRWERDPRAAACRAYCGLRQELSILVTLRHPHVVPLCAATAAPIAALLQLAPQGALDTSLRNYRSCGARVGTRAARALALQAAKALEYLHAKRVVYRDLKSENVLVWSLPTPQQSAAAEMSPEPIPVHIKLGDYGISRLAPPSGTKGFGGTEGFMAPEIMRYNGEEEYNEKVDCFSYGMLLYEILTLRQPYEGHEAVKEAVLEGARPTLSVRELQWGCVPLECMRRCWTAAPGRRPAAAALVAVAAAPEWAALQDAASAGGGGAAIAAAAAPLAPATDDSSSESGGWEIWWSSGPGVAHSLVATLHAFTHQHTIRVPPYDREPVSVTAMCRVRTDMWLGDNAGRVSVYSISTMSPLWSVRVQDSVGGAESGVAALVYLASLQRVALALECGRLFLVSSQRPDAVSESGGGFVLTELGAATSLRCLTAAGTPDRDGFSVWAGGDALYTYKVTSSGVCGAAALPVENVALLAACEASVVAYCDPGVCVSLWSVSSEQQVARLDCSKLAPVSESLQSIAIDERPRPERCRVTALCAFNSMIYIGTEWGCIVVCDNALRPVTVFRPYEANVSAIVPLPCPSAGGAAHAQLATLGERYRPLLQRFVPPDNNTTITSFEGTYCLLWRADHWLPD